MRPDVEIGLRKAVAVVQALVVGDEAVLVNIQLRLEPRAMPEVSVAVGPIPEKIKF